MCQELDSKPAQSNATMAFKNGDFMKIPVRVHSDIGWQLECHLLLNCASFIEFSFYIGNPKFSTRLHCTCGSFTGQHRSEIGSTKLTSKMRIKTGQMSYEVSVTDHQCKGCQHARDFQRPLEIAEA